MNVVFTINLSGIRGLQRTAAAVGGSVESREASRNGDVKEVYRQNERRKTRCRDGDEGGRRRRRRRDAVLPEVLRVLGGSLAGRVAAKDERYPRLA